MKPYIQEQNEIREDYKIKKKSSAVRDVLCSKTAKGLLFVSFFAIAVPLLMYYFVIDEGSYEADDDHTCLVNKTYRIQCGNSNNVTIDYCDQINCCYDNSAKICFHYLPSKYYYFQETNEEVYKPSLTKTPFGSNLFENIAVTVNELDENSIQIILHDPNVKTASNEVGSNKNYILKRNDTPMSVEIYRNETGELLLTTAKGPTIISENYWEWSFQLTEQYLFGLGQILIDLDENSTLTKVIYGNNLDHNTLPVFMAYNNGKYHGLIVRHSGPLEVTVLPSKLVSLKSLAGSQIVLELCIGPTPKDVIRQQRKKQTNFVDLWSLGVHICREGDSLSLNEILEEYEQEAATYDFRYESDCLHQNLIMALRKENIKENINLTQAIAKLKAQSKHFILSLPPQILVNSSIYEDSKNLSVFYEYSKDLYQGHYLNTDVIYPYFGHEFIGTFIEKLFLEIKSYLKEHFPTDLLLNHNWPSDESFKMKRIDNFQYLSKDLIEAMSSTLPWNVTGGNELQIIHHNDYGAQQLKSVVEGLKSNVNDTVLEEILIMTASHNFDESNPIIIQNYDISWNNFKSAITKTLSNSIFGDYLLSIPVCGSTDNYDTSVHESLCMRWYLMASTAPFFRISSDYPRRDPNSLNSQTASKTAKLSIDIRYKLQYYFYTVLNNFEPLMRPMFYDFSDDNTTFGLDEQYMVGKSILVAHPTIPYQSQLSIYLPKSVEVWYEFWGGLAYHQNSTKNGWITINIVETEWIGYIAHGSVIPTREIKADNSSVLKLIVALKLNENTADGSLLIGSDIFAFKSTEKRLTIEKREKLDLQKIISTEAFILDEILIYQMGTNPRSIQQIVCLVVITASATIESTTRMPISDEAIEATLNDRRYLLRQLKCALGEATCDPVGRRLKSLAPLVLRGSCPQCTVEEMRQIQKVLAFVQKNYPKEWNKILQQYAG
ncbi:maltase-glucoamylase-like protein, partial [Asbolus verrucosus]